MMLMGRNTSTLLAGTRSASPKSGGVWVFVPRALLMKVGWQMMTKKEDFG